MKAPSARGLFRATGKETKPVSIEAGSDLGGAFEKKRYRERVADGFEPTPPEATIAFMQAEQVRLQRYSRIWESAVGDGRMAEIIAGFGHQVVGSDLVDRGWPGVMVRSYFDFATPPCVASITNPPFHEASHGGGKARWIKHGLDVLGLEYMALLLPWSWPGASGLGALWDRRPPARVYLMTWRLDFTGQGAQPALHAFYVWDSECEPDPDNVRLLRLDRPKHVGQGGLL